MDREEVLARYRRWRKISVDHHSAASRHLSRQAILDGARRLGLCRGRQIIADSGDELTLIADFALYTAGKGRLRGIDRYARAAALPPGSDEAFVLDAMCAAPFGLWRVQRRHEMVGVIVSDLSEEESGERIWLVDEGLDKSAAPGSAFAARLARFGDFAMHSGVVVPLDRAMLEDAFDALSEGEEDWIEHPRFIGTLYRIAIERGYFALNDEKMLDAEDA
jgi:hypothetical protein